MSAGTMGFLWESQSPGGAHLRRGRKGGRLEVAWEGPEGVLRAGCACRCPRPWEVYAFPALGIWDNFVQPFVVFSGN